MVLPALTPLSWDVCGNILPGCWISFWMLSSTLPTTSSADDRSLSHSSSDSCSSALMTSAVMGSAQHSEKMGLRSSWITRVQYCGLPNLEKDTQMYGSD